MIVLEKRQIVAAALPEAPWNAPGLDLGERARISLTNRRRLLFTIDDSSANSAATRSGRISVAARGLRSLG